MTTQDVRHCHRCRRELPATPLDPVHTCNHGVPCNPTDLRRCTPCMVAWRAWEGRTGPRRDELTAQVETTLREPNAALAAIGGRAVPGVSAGPAGVVRRGR